MFTTLWFLHDPLECFILVGSFNEEKLNGLSPSDKQMMSFLGFHFANAKSAGFADWTMSLMMRVTYLENSLDLKNLTSDWHLPLFVEHGKNLLEWTQSYLWLSLHSQMFALSPTYSLPGAFIMAVCVIVTKGKTPSLFPVHFTVVKIGNVPLSHKH